MVGSPVTDNLVIAFHESICEVSNLEVSIKSQEEVLRFQVNMCYIIGVHIVNSFDQLMEDGSCQSLILEDLALVEQVSEVDFFGELEELA